MENKNNDVIEKEEEKNSIIEEDNENLTSPKN